MGPPVGVVLISILTGFYGLMWILAATLASPPGNAWAAYGPFIGLAVLALAVGLWTLRPLAWLFTLALYGIGSLWTITEVLAGESSRLMAVFVGFVIVVYLVARKDRFVGPESVVSGRAE